MQKNPFDRYEEVVINVLWFCPAKLRKSSKIALILMMILCMGKALSKAKIVNIQLTSAECLRKRPTGTTPSDYILSRN